MRAPGSQSINKIVGRTIEWCRLFKILKSCRIVYEHLIIRILYFSRCPEDPPPPNCTIQCDKYIYPILDWEDHPGKDNIKCRPLTKSSFVKQILISGHEDSDLNVDLNRAIVQVRILLHYSTVILFAQFLLPRLFM